MTPTDQDRLIDEALSRLRDAMAEIKHPAVSKDAEEVRLPLDALPITKTVSVVETKTFASPPAAEQSVTEHPSQTSARRPTQEQQGNKTLSMVAVAISESTAPEPPYLLQSPVTQQDIVSKEVKQDQAVPLIAEALSMVKSVSAAEHIRNAVRPQSLQQSTKPREGSATLSQGVIAEGSSAEERLAMQRADVRERVQMFKATQERFKREREEYYAATMAKVRAALHSSP